MNAIFFPFIRMSMYYVRMSVCECESVSKEEVAGKEKKQAASRECMGYLYSKCVHARYIYHRQLAYIMFTR